MGTPTTISINYDLAASETGITLGSTSDEQSTRVDMENGLFIQVLFRDDNSDNL